MIALKTILLTACIAVYSTNVQAQDDCFRACKNPYTDSTVFVFEDNLSELIGCRSPKFNITTIDNLKFKQNGSNDNVYVLNFWFMGCRPCIEDIPFMNKLVEEFEGDRVTFLALNPIDSRETLITNFMSRFYLKYEIASITKEFSEKYCVFLYPGHFVLDRKGMVITAFVGLLEDEEKYAKIKSSINLALSNSGEN